MTEEGHGEVSEWQIVGQAKRSNNSASLVKIQGRIKRNMLQK